MVDAILSTLQKYDRDGNNMQGWGYDGTAAMSSKLNDVQLVISEQYPTAIYEFHSFGLCWNSINL